MSNPHPSRAAITNGSRVMSERAAAEREYKFSEARHLMKFGIDPDQIARQLCTTRAALERLAERHHEYKIARYMRPTRLRGTCDTCGDPTVKPTAKECRGCYDLRRAEGAWAMRVPA